MPSIPDRLNSLEIENAKLRKEISHIAKDIEENRELISRIKDTQEKQEILIQSLVQSRASERKLISVLLSLAGALVGFVIKSVLS